MTLGQFRETNTPYPEVRVENIRDEAMRVIE